MKKFLALFIVLAVLAPAVFAQDAGITFSGWGRGVFAPIQVIDPDTGNKAKVDGDGDLNAEGDPGVLKVYAGVGKWSPYPRVGFTVKGNAEKVGFQADIFVLENGLTSTGEDQNGDLVSVVSSGEGVPVGDNAYIWAKPWDFLKVNVGKFKDDTLRGKFGDTNFSGGITLGMGAEDDIFTRFSGDGLGAEVALTPIEGLYIAALVNAGGFPGTHEAIGSYNEAKYVYEKIQVGAGYEIAKIGHARAQFVGGRGVLTPGAVGDIATVDPKNAAAKIELAFALTAVENLLVDIGGKIWLPADKVLDPTDTDQYATKKAENGASYSNPLGVSVGASYDLDAFNITGRVDTQIGVVPLYKDDDTEYKTGFYLNVHLVPSYNFGFATVGADIGLQVNPEITKKDLDDPLDKGGIEFGAGLWIQKDLGNGLIKTGFGVTVPTENHKAPNADATKSDFVFTIPVILEYSF